LSPTLNGSLLLLFSLLLPSSDTPSSVISRTVEMTPSLVLPPMMLPWAILSTALWLFVELSKKELMGWMAFMTSSSFIKIEWLLYTISIWDIITKHIVPRNITYTGSLIFSNFNRGRKKI